MCKYCEMNDSDLAQKDIMLDQHVNLGIVDNINLSTIIQDKNVLCTYFTNKLGDVLAEYNTLIKYCPMCGKKLEGLETD